MDPDKALHRVTELAREVLDIDTDEVDTEDLIESAWELCETILGLDEWLRKGGFFPALWKGRGSKRNRQERDAGQTLQAIHANMDGKGWSPDTLDTIAELLRGAGFTIHEPADKEE